jgi:hypothetical protein
VIYSPSISRERTALVEVPLPVGWDCAGRARYGLVARVTVGRGQRRPLEELTGAVVVEPVLARLKALEHRVPGRLEVRRGVLAR